MVIPWRRFWTRGEYALARIVRPDVLERAGVEGRKIFAIEALEQYLESWQWDRSTGGPKAEFRGPRTPLKPVSRFSGSRIRRLH